MDEIELQGRIEAVAKFALKLAAELEITGVIDGPRFCQTLRGAERMEDQIEYIRIARKRIAGMADVLDEARWHRQDQARQVG